MNVIHLSRTLDTNFVDNYNHTLRVKQTSHGHYSLYFLDHDNEVFALETADLVMIAHLF